MKNFKVRVTSIHGHYYGIKDVLELHWLKGYHLVEGVRPTKLVCIVVDFVDNIKVYDKGTIFHYQEDGTFLDVHKKLKAVFVE